MHEQLAARIDDRTARVGVVGLGYVGLPLVRALLDAGFATLGFDVDGEKIEQLRRGECYVKHMPHEWLTAGLQDGRFEPTDQMDRLVEADAVLICVPTPLADDRDPDLSFVEQTARQVARSLRPGQLIVLESTTYPGTTREVVAPLLEASGLVAERDFFLAYSPERENPGDENHSARKIPKVVAGFGPHSARLVEQLYAAVVERVVPVSTLEVAEACKIVENVYRAVNIAMVNELKILFQRMDIDVWEVIDAARTKPFGFQAFYPGPGMGGHCIPIDPFYLSWLARRHGVPTRFIELAGEINNHMPQYVVDHVARALNDRGLAIRNSRICLLGMAYKKDVDDPRESPGFLLFELLAQRGAQLTYSDPHIPRLPKMRKHDLPPLASETLSPEFLAAQDCVVIVTDHSAFDYDEIVRHAPLVVDTRNATRHVTAGREKIVRA